MKKKIPQTAYAYFAGYIDGDGCFYIGQQKTKRRLRLKPVVSLIVSSVNKHVLESFKESFGGSICLVSKEHDNSKALYHYTIKKRNTIKMADCIFQYLVEKKEECKTTISFCNSKNSDQKNTCINKMKILKNTSNLVAKKHKEEFEKHRSTIAPTHVDFAYLAGFIDAECSLGIQKYKPKGRPNYVYKIILQCNNTKSPVFKWLLQRFGGRIHFIDRTNYSKGSKNQLTWRLSGKALSKILESIYPFLRHKKPVCRELMNFYQTTIPDGMSRRTEKFRSDYAKIIVIREKIIQNVHKLNLKGINNT